MAKEFNARIYTTHFLEKDGFYEDMKNRVVNTGITFGRFEKIKSVEMLIRLNTRCDVDADFHIYSLIPPRFEAVTNKVPFLYYAHQYSTYGLPNYTLQKIAHRYLIKPEHIIANSNHVSNRLALLYGCRPRAIIYPPLRLNEFYHKKSEDFYLTVSRLENWKRIDLQITAFRNSGKKLVIVGDGPDKHRLETIACAHNSNVNFLGRVSDRELRDLYARCTAFIFTSRDEPLGLAPVEALASGKPILCISEGGPLEYLNDGKNCLLFNDATQLREIIDNCKPKTLDAMESECLKSASKFDSNTIFAKMRECIAEIIDEGTYS